MPLVMNLRSGALPTEANLEENSGFTSNGSIRDSVTRNEDLIYITPSARRLARPAVRDLSAVGRNRYGRWRRRR